MTITIFFSVEHPSLPNQDGQNTVDFTFDAQGKSDASAHTLIEIVRKAALEVKKAVVREHIMVRGSYETEAAFEKDVARFAAEARISDVNFAGKDVRWIAHGIYSDDEAGDWREHVHAPTAGTAEFFAMWTMAVNEDVSPEEDFDAFLKAMSGINITECSPEPVTEDELRAALKALVEEASQAGHSGPMLDDAVTKLQALGYEPQLASAGPRP